MSYYQKITAIVAGSKWVFLLTTVFFTLTGLTPAHVSFSGEWKFNESKSELGQFPLCIFGGDRMRSKTMKIVAHAGFLTVDVAGSSADGALVTRQEKLIFEGKESKITYVGVPRKQSAAKWSGDGQTMMVNSIRSFDTACKTADFRVTEVWKLINRGKSIAIEVKSISSNVEKTMKLVYDKHTNLVYDKQRAADYRF